MNWHIDCLAAELEELAKGVALRKPRKHDLAINIPPGTTKTKLCSVVFPVWCWTLWPWMSFITASYSAELSLESAELSRDLVRSESFQAMYPWLGIKQDKDTKGNFKIITKKYVSPGHLPQEIPGGSRFSTSVGGTLMGFHGHIQIVDDPIDPKRAVSKAELQTALAWMDTTLPTRKTDKAATPLVLIMQRLAQNDPTGHLLAKKKSNVRHISLPGEIRNFRDCVRPPELVAMYKDDLLDPVRMGWDVLKDLEADLGQYGYAGQIGQNPTSPQGGMFKVDHFQIVPIPPVQVNFVMTVRYWDKAGSAGKGCYTVGTKMSLLRGNRWIVMDVKRGQWSTEERERVILETARADGQDVVVWIEQEPGSGGKESAEGTIRNLAGYVCKAEGPTGDKVFRADPYSVQVNNGNIMLLQADWNYEFIEEHRYFPNGTYKDQVDASAGAFNHLRVDKVVERIL
jgi:predicted phage terminase large subunit-like protein